MTFFGEKGMIFGALIPVLLYLGLIIGIGIMAVYGFIILIRFLKAGTKAFNLYIQKNCDS